MENRKKQTTKITKVLNLKNFSDDCYYKLKSEMKQNLASYSHGSFNLPSLNQIPIFCGGHKKCEKNCRQISAGWDSFFKFAKVPSKTCYLSNTDSYFEGLLIPRSFSSTLSLENYETLIIGGIIGDRILTTKTTEVLSSNKLSMQGPELPFKIGIIQDKLKLNYHTDISVITRLSMCCTSTWDIWKRDDDWW